MKLSDVLNINEKANCINDTISMFNVDEDRSIELFDEIKNALSVSIQIAQNINGSDEMDIMDLNIGYILDKIDYIEFENEKEMMLIVYLCSVVVNTLKEKAIQRHINKQFDAITSY